MPWDAASFHKHNRGLTPAQSGHAARIANAVLKRSGNEGMAIAVANRDMKRAAGGSVDRRYAKNEDWTDRLPPAQGTIDPWMLMNIPDDMPEASVYTPDLHPDIEGKSEPLKRQPSSYAFGGMAPGLSNDPTLHPHMFASVRPAAGFLNGATPGRADALHTKTRGGSYVFPADVVAAAGQGNSAAGARALQGLLGTGPYGVPLLKGGKGMGMPARTAPRFPAPRRLADGGASDDMVDVALSDGELVATPEQMVALGGGDIKRGHKIADHLVMEIRRRHIANLKKLPGPVGSKAK